MKTLLLSVSALIAMYVGSGPRVRRNVGMFGGKVGTLSNRDIVELVAATVAGMYVMSQFQRLIARQMDRGAIGDAGDWALTFIAAAGIMLVAYACGFALRKMVAHGGAVRQ